MFKNFLFLLGWAVSTAVVAQPYIPGQAYFGANNYIEYLAGNLPLIISVPHGGILLPAGIPDRDCDGCSYARDINTQELARAVYEAVHDQTGCWPHVIINRLHRRKLDANRDLPEAADGNPQAELAWTEFHQYIDAAKEATQLQFNKGFYIDLHGHIVRSFTSATTIQAVQNGRHRSLIFMATCCVSRIWSLMCP